MFLRAGEGFEHKFNIKKVCVFPVNVVKMQGKEFENLGFFYKIITLIIRTKI